MDEEIKEIIRKALPQHVGETLQSELSRLPVLEGLNKRLESLKGINKSFGWKPS